MSNKHENGNDYKKDQKNYWQSLRENLVKKSAKPDTSISTEAGMVEMSDVSRRNFLSLMGASIAFSGLGFACRQPEHKIVPYAKMPEYLVPGVPRFFASSYVINGIARSVLVESHENRPTKLDGNPEHPGSIGATDSFTQAMILDLYDPDRSKTPSSKGSSTSKADFDKFADKHFADLKKKGGQGFAVISENLNGPSFNSLRQEFASSYPNAKWVSYESSNCNNSSLAASSLYGEAADFVNNLKAADVILSVGSDFMGNEAGKIKDAYHFTQGRKVNEKNKTMNRLYVVESEFTLTGGAADNRLILSHSETEAFIRGLAKKILPDIQASQAGNGPSSTKAKKWVNAVAKDLKANKGKSLVTVGKALSKSAHALGHLINLSLGNIGKTQTVFRDPSAQGNQIEDLKALTTEMNAGKIDTLVIFGGDPVYNAPSDLNFATSLKKVKNSIHLSYYKNHTASVCAWQLNRSHFLEEWSDGYSEDGTVSFGQPSIRPLHNGVSHLEFLSQINGAKKNSYEIVKALWSKVSGNGFGSKWRQYLHDGFISGSNHEPISANISDQAIKSSLADNSANAAPSKGSYEIRFKEDYTAFDGRFANNGWLHELPNPITKLTWDNVVSMSAKTAEGLGVENEDLVEIEVSGKKAKFPVYILPGQADYSLGLTLGYGQNWDDLKIGQGVGFNSESIRTSSGFWASSGAKVKKVDGNHKLASVQTKRDFQGYRVDNREDLLLRERNIDQYKKDGNVFKKLGQEQAYNYPEIRSVWEAPFDYSKGHQWGLSIDLNSCIGCGGCTIACQAENNIPIVGKENVLNGREMHWIRVDSYFTGDENNPKFVNQPMPCQQCENAPCESVCPVSATTHSPDGLNDMTYNRCIGTRYCSNNCPIKVRRFNFFNYTKMQNHRTTANANPDVTVRFRGVMEKCTYCVQRIQAAKINAKVDGRRPVKDGEITPACAQACPTKAITFGDINDPQSEVSKAKAQNTNYNILEEYNLKPRTSYGARIKNPNPELAGV